MDNRNNCIITKSKDNTAFYSQRVIVLAFILIFLTISNSFGEPKLITCVELSNFFDPKTDYEVIMIEGNEIVCRIPLPGEAVIVDTENASPVYAIKGKSSTMLAQVSDNGKILHFAEFHSFDCEPDEILYVSESSVVYSNEVGIVTRSANSSEKEYVLPLELNDSLVFYSVSHGGDIAVCSNADLFVKYGDESVWRHIFSASRSMSTNTEVGIPLCWVDSTLFFFVEKPELHQACLYSYDRKENIAKPHHTHNGNELLIKEANIYGKMCSFNNNLVLFSTDQYDEAYSPNGGACITMINTNTGAICKYPSLHTMFSQVKQYDFINYSGFYRAKVLVLP